jgi:hypothetical protein
MNEQGEVVDALGSQDRVWAMEPLGVFRDDRPRPAAFLPGFTRASRAIHSPADPCMPIASDLVSHKGIVPVQDLRCAGQGCSEQ